MSDYREHYVNTWSKVESPPVKRKKRRTKAEIEASKEIKVQEVQTPKLAKAEKKESAESIEQNQEPTRMSTVWAGAKDGAAKRSVKRMVNKISDPLAEKIAPSLEGIVGPNVPIAKEAIKLALSFGLVLMAAELVEKLAPGAAHYIPGKKPEEVAKTSKNVATWLRRYAGEEFAGEIVDAAIEYLPQILKQFASVAELFAATAEIPVVETEQQEEVAK